ncbi:hypothetical protein EPUS_08474 [Endocarpon pusillum Z07020]|uniref:Heterokaryon incompatibility domain-containing protein n=1 Tax=Endocarpon pusillum (strain Z07020 / HMAS-L-300199) TaxID=1263415 RepID=U1GPL6_ENDPU|nr:uncharacterized protein EPUS_08474 [Endocarpon pusillum Z07020]ERF74253.1 hypothetical protein EPUS_08474 [Endocarpon pusillum Z07020]
MTLNRYDDMEYNVTVAGLSSSADHGCSWCTLLLENILKNTKPKGNWPPLINLLSVNIACEDEEYVCEIVLGAFTASRTHAADFFLSIPERKTAPLGFNVERCQKWLHACQNSHDRCAGGKSYLPTRILDVAPQMGDSYVALHVSQPKEVAAYLVLSYRWGGPQHITLATSTMEAFCNGIKLDTLPQTLKDAVEVTKGFNVRYLWVDALCIKQDSAEDKAMEISKMHQYYRNASVVIQPTGLKSVQDGFLGKNINAPHKPDIAPTTNPKILEEYFIRVPFFTLNGIEDSILLQSDPTMYEPRNEPLNHRAWVLQERLLGRRLLIFPSSGGLVWRCELYEQTDGRVYMSKAATEGRERVMRQTSQSLQPQEIHYSWRAIIDFYSGCDMTDPADKLVAIGAVADHYFELYGTQLGTYCAGLWFNFLVRDLDWYLHPDSLSARPRIYRAPTWSWAAVDGQLVDFYGIRPVEDKCPAKIISCETILSCAQAPFGSVSGGCLRLEGALKKFTWSDNSGSMSLFDDQSQMECPDYDLSVYPDSLEDVIIDRETLSFLLLRSWSMHNFDEGKWIMSGLMLQPTEGGLHRRTGAFLCTTYNETWFDQ